MKRPRNTMPAFIRLALVSGALMDAYKSRPAYQQNDYIGWITRAKREETRAKRLKQMLDELDEGERYMGMVYRKPEARPQKRGK
jgi:Bacteriocin-protection, YdeI or OmpD-Associated